MRRILAYVAIATVTLALPPSTAEAKHHHYGSTAHHHFPVRRHFHASDGGLDYGHSARAHPGRGYVEAPTDRSYQGPGSEVFRRSEQSQQSPGTTLELDPAVKESATGGPSGGLPNNGAGP